jgi:predicted nucleotidyltransferase
VVLFGSRARGGTQSDSDYDIAVFLRDLVDRETEMNRLADIATEILYNGLRTRDGNLSVNLFKHRKSARRAGVPGASGAKLKVMVN